MVFKLFLILIVTCLATLAHVPSTSAHELVNDLYARRLGNEVSHLSRRQNNGGNNDDKEEEEGKEEEENEEEEEESEPTQPSGLPADAAFCGQVGLGNKLGDGTQQKDQTCSVTVQGAIPAFNNMVSSIILEPKTGAEIKSGTEFTVSVRTQGMNLGFFEDPQTRYYLSPQTLAQNGNIEGHQHVTIQRLGNSQNPPDPRTEALVFFKGLDQPTNDGVLSVQVTADKTAGVTGDVRICTITGSRGHQPVIMPVAQRGSQDDCIRVKFV